MSFVAAAWVMGGTWAADKLMGGVGAMGNKADIAAAKQASWDIYQNKLNLLNRSNDLQVSKIQYQTEQELEGLDIGLGRAALGVSQARDKLARKRGFAGDQQVISEAEQDMSKLWGQYQSNQKGIYDTRKMSLEGQSIALQQGRMGLEEELASGPAIGAGVPQTFFEGMFV